MGAGPFYVSAGTGTRRRRPRPLPPAVIAAACAVLAVGYFSATAAVWTVWIGVPLWLVVSTVRRIRRRR